MKKIILLLFSLFLSVYSIGQSTSMSNPGLSDMGSGIAPLPNAPTGQTQVIVNPQPNSMTQWVLPNTNSTSGNSRIPRNAGLNYQREEFLVLPSEMAASGFPSGYNIDGIGFLIYTAGVGTQTGTMNIYLRNTNDVTYTLGSTWTTTGFTMVSTNAAWTVPIAVGAYSIPFVGGSTFTYTGGGVYVAWEFSNPGGVMGTTALTAYCNTNQASLCYGYQGTVPGTALALTAFRPATTFTNNALTDIAAVTNIYALERMPTPYSNPGTCGVRVANVSASAQTFDLTLTLKDVATSTVRYTQTQTVTALAGGTAATVTFTGISPTIQENVNFTATTSVIPGETYTTNNTLTISGEVNCNLYSYNYNTAGAGGYGYTYPGTGIFAAKYTMNGTGTIKGANVVLYNYATNVGNTVYAVMINSAGTIIAQSPNYTLLAGDMGTNKYFAFSTPQAVTNDFFYVGLAQTAGTAQWYPLGTYPESPARGGTFYVTTLAGGTMTADAVKYGIEAKIQRAPTVVTNAATVITSSGATLNATVSANTSTTTSVFQYSTDLSFSSSVTVAGNVTTQGAAVSAAITGLQPNTLYNFRAVSTNADGVTTGNTLTFTTLAVAPSVSTVAATMVGSSFATMNGSATAFNANTTVSFEYGTTVAYGSTAAGVPASITGNTATGFSASITALTIHTTYHYRAKGVNIAGTTYGTDMTFFTTCVIPAAPGAISGPASVCKNGSGYVYSVVQVPYAFVYAWTFPAGFTITSYPNSNSVTVSVSAAALSGTISVLAQSDCGAISPSSSTAVTVNNLPVPTVAGSSPVCQSAGNNYTTQAGQSAYVWTATPDGTVTPTGNPQVVTITWAAIGTKTVGVVYTNPATGCTAAAPGGTFTVTVNAAPVPTIVGNNNMCINSGYYDYTTETGKTSYVWSVSSGGIITAGQGTAVAQVMWNTPGAQSVSVNYNNASNCSAPSPTVYNVTVSGIPGGAGTISGSSSVCFGTSGVAYSVPAITNAASYIWSLPAGATIASGSGSNSITVNFAPNAVSGNITVYGNSICGNGTASAPFAVTIMQLPLAAGTVTGLSSVCAGEMGVAYSVPPVTNATGYTWNLPSGATIVSGANTPDITVDFASGSASGNISVFGTNGCGYGTVSPVLAVTVSPIPEAPLIYAHGDTLFSNIASGNQWYYEGAPIATGTGPTLIAHYTGWYWDVVTQNSCSSDSSNHIHILVTGINDPKASSFVVYPVPNNGMFKLMMNSQSAGSFDISICNTVGVTIYTKQNVEVKGSQELMIDLRPIPAGVYTMIIRNGETKVVRKIIVN